LLGLFAIPAALLWSGHRLRRQSARWRSAFWGAFGGYCVGSCIALGAGMAPPAMWSGDDVVRGLLGFGSLVTLPAIGALIGAFRASRD
jgi:hypothetical protein